MPRHPSVLFFLVGLVMLAGACASSRYEPQKSAQAAFQRFVEVGMGKGDVEGACAVVSSNFRSTLKRQGVTCERFVKSRHRPDYSALTIDTSQLSEGQRMTRIPRGAVKTRSGGTLPFDVLLSEVASGFGSGWVVEAVEEGGS